MGSHVIRTKNFAVDADDFIFAGARNALGERNEFRIALAGGKTPLPIYTRLAAIGRDLPGDLARITLGDEPCVPPAHRHAKFPMALETLLAPSAVPEKSIRRMPGAIA